MAKSLKETILNFLPDDYTNGKQTTPDTEFQESDGTTGMISMSYVYSSGGFRGRPEAKILFIKRIERFGERGGGLVSKTLQEILRDTELTEIIIESIQNPAWVESLERHGWTIYYTDILPHAKLVKNKGGKKSKRKSKRKKSTKSNIGYYR
jgi:hypothetical protein